MRLNGILPTKRCQGIVIIHSLVATTRASSWAFHKVVDRLCFAIKITYVTSYCRRLTSL